jgi:hypothetical protein
MPPPALAELLLHLAPRRRRLVEHPVRSALRTLDHVRTFQEHHVFAVLDFMSLLKALQRALTCTDVPWVPRGDPAVRRFVNEIVLGEESDTDGRGGFTSHFELYLSAMRETGASTSAVETLLARLAAGIDVDSALTCAPPAAAAFARTTFAIARSGSLPAVASAFTLGREELIPDMFRALVAGHDVPGAPALPILVDYLERHIHLDGDEHGPLAARLLTSVCGDDPDHWRAARTAAERALDARLALWDGVVAAMAGQDDSAASLAIGAAHR